MSVPNPIIADLNAEDEVALNLRCAVGLPGSERLDVDACLRQLDDWAAIVARATDRMLPRFHASPQEFNDSEAYFRVLVMVTVLQRNLGVTYRNEFREGPIDCSDSRSLFIHGLLNGYGGTCASMPVLNVVMGRRLGYPLRLVGAKQHLFVRWDEGGERFNIECTSRGLNCYPDEHYHHWPLPLTERDLRRGHYLRSMTRPEELACFLASRGHCLRDNLRLEEAFEAFSAARKLAPRDPNYRGFHAVVAAILRELRGEADYGILGPAAGDHVLIGGKRRRLQPWEAWAVPHARAEYARISRLPQARRPMSPMKGNEARQEA